MKTVNISTQKIRSKLRALSEEVSSFDSAWLVLYKMENWLMEIEEGDSMVEKKFHWKPSEEQMKALKWAIAIMEIREASDYDISPLKELYEQLKKSKGEEEPEYYQHFDPDC